MKKQWGPCDIVGFKQHLEDMLKRMFKEVIKKLSFPSTFFFFFNVMFKHLDFVVYGVCLHT